MDNTYPDECFVQSKFNELHFDLKDHTMEKGSIEMKEKDINFFTSEKESMKDIYDSSGHKHFDYETLNQDLADIEERLRQTRQSWNKSARTTIPDISEIGVRKSFSMLDIERKTYSSASSNADLDKYDGEKLTGVSPAISESLLKWDYGADIGLNQEDSDDMEPITWPVTAEEALRNEKDALNRRMKQSLSQGSFLASPDPDDKHNLVTKVSEEYRSKNGHLSQFINYNRRQYHSVSALSPGKYDDISARQIMEDAEAAEKRLRERLETVKAVHLNGKLSSKKIIEDDKDLIPKRSGYFTEEPFLTKVYENSKVQDVDNFVIDTKTNLSKKSMDESVPDVNGSNVVEDGSRSQTSVTNTGRTTTIESTHTSSDYGKAPVFQPEAYGTRTDYQSSDNNYSIYSKRNKDKYVERCRPPCGIAPELDTISSRETLQTTDEKKDISLLHDKDSEPNQLLKHRTINEGNDTNLNVNNDIQKVDSLQLKWDRFKSNKKDDDHDMLFDKTVLRSALQYNSPNSHRQHSSATTFTTITNVSPRFDSFATDAVISPHRENQNFDTIPDANQDAAGDNKTKKSSTKLPEKDEKKTTDYHRSYTRQGSNSRSRRIAGGTGNGQDDDDDEDEISQTEKRRIRHSGGVKNSKKRFGSGQLDGETTASELEHDDVVKYRQNSNDRGGRCRQLSQMLTDLSRKGAAEETIVDVSDRSDSSSVDTMNLMNRMSKLLGKQSKDTAYRESSNQNQEKPCERPMHDSTHYKNKHHSNKNNVSKITESDDGMLMLKHLMLKQKVKWLADCAREEARRRKVKKLQKLIDMYEQGDRVVIPSDLETDTATLMGSERGSQLDLESQTDSYSQFDEVTPMDYKKKHEYNQPQQPKKNLSKPANEKHHQERQLSKKNNQYPVSETWNIPLRDNHSNSPVEDVNSSNWCGGISMADKKRPMQRYRSPCSRAESSYRDNNVNLSAKERVRIKYELEMARQKNAHECQKDMRHLRTGNIKVSPSGLSWIVGSSSADQSDGVRKISHSNGSENFKEKGSIKSDLQLAFENSMESFISRSRQRQKRIQLSADDRRYESQMNMERSKLFANNGGMCNGVPKRRPVTRPDPLSALKTIDKITTQRRRQCNSAVDHRTNRSYTSENLYKPRRRRLSKRDMMVQSARKYKNLPEVQAKYVDERRRARIQNNRMRMQLYSEKILQAVLRNRGPWVSEGR